MESILIHPNTKEQVKVFEKMAKALNIPFEIENNNSKITFIDEFNKAKVTGLTVEQSRKKTLDFVDKLWSK